jgi:acetyl esterase
MVFLSSMRVRVLRAAGRALIFGRAGKLAQWKKRAEIARGLDPETAAMLALGEITGDAALTGGSVESARKAMREGVLIAEDPVEVPVDTRDTHVKGAGAELGARVYTPRGLGAPSPGLMYIHGGGWVTGDLNTHDTLCRKLAYFARCRVVAIEPRLAPEHVFPTAYEDSIAAFRDVAARAHEFGMDPSRLGVGGDSAGGNLSAGVGLATREDNVRPRLQLLLYPACDGTMSMASIRENGEGLLLHEASLRWYLDHYLGKKTAPSDPIRKDPRLSPYWAPSVEGAPPALSVIAGFDPLRDEGLAYAKRLQDAGIFSEVQHARAQVHGFALLTGLSRSARTETEQFCMRTGELLRR